MDKLECFHGEKLFKASEEPTAPGLVREIATAGFEINARPLARGDWKPRGMSRIFAQVVRRASEYFNLFCQLGMTMNETNYWNLTTKSIKIITNR